MRVSTKWMVNLEHGYLVPATMHNWNSTALRPYTGPFPTTTAKLKQWLKQNTVQDTRDQLSDPDEPFELSKASKDELIAFAKASYDVDLDPSKTVAVLRREVADLAEGAGA